MRASQLRLRRLLSGIGLTVALATTVLVPAGYFLVVRSNFDATLSFEARLKANRLAKYIYANGALWQYQIVRLAATIEVPEADRRDFQQRVFDANGKLVLETGSVPEFPVAMRQAPIIVGGAEVGRLESSGSFRPQLIGTALVALFSAVLGFGMYLALRVFPLRALDRTLGALNAQTHRFESALGNMSQGLCMFDADGRLAVSNRRFAELFGIAEEAVTLGMTEAELMHLSELATGHGTGAGESEGTTILRRANGNVIAVLRQPMALGGEVVTYEDVTERQRAEALIAHMARHDGLTDLPNRTLFHEELAAALAQRNGDERVAVLFLDLDNFKSVNDTLGHAAGDEVLRAISKRLKNVVREGDTIARFGGDEFAIVQTGLTDLASTTALAVRLIEAMATPLRVHGHEILIGTSVGIAISPGDGTDPSLLLRNADMALYRAKADGRGTYRYFEAEMDARLHARRVRETALRQAIAHDELELHYQPIVSVGTEELVGLEALLRWNHPAGQIQPNDFISIAEETGLIVPIGEWVIATACREAAGWPGEVKVAVNLSPVQVRSPDLVPAVKAALTASALAPNRLELEITESVLLQENEHTLEVLRQLRALGVSISMDDFGTGYASLSYLRKFPFDKIKIDQSFIQDMAEREDSLAIVRAVSAIGVSLGIRTTAEGVETREQFEQVKTEGCTEAQGFLFSPPRRAGEVPALFAELAHRPAVTRLRTLRPRVVPAVGRTAS